MRNDIRILLLMLIVCAGVTRHTQAATLTVETDGSGDFIIIQDALDAAAVGDSILIGEGRFDTFRVGNTNHDGSAFAGIMWVTTDSLTIIGAGRDLTIVGPEIATDEELGEGTASLVVDTGALTYITGITFEHTRWIANFFHQTTIENCRTRRVPFGNTAAMFFSTCEDAIVRDCEFLGENGLVTAGGVKRLTVEGCHFDAQSPDELAVVIGNGAKDCMIRRCSFVRGGVGVQFSLGGTGWVEDCTFEDIRVVGIDLSGGSAIVRRCHIGQTRMCLRGGSGRLEVYDSVIEGGTQYTIATTADMYLRNCHILNAGAPTVFGRVAPGNGFVDVRENWWGTDDLVQIESWIDDSEGTVLWQPVLTQPVPSDQESIGGLKGQFRRRN
ncbi:hypothetical protein DRQ32_11675 [bacterium]|nr:MAG: hypothetical protein DRQ32_11675 [bacterium]